MTTSTSQPGQIMPGGDMDRQHHHIISTTQVPPLAIRTDVMENYNIMTPEQHHHQQQQHQHQHHQHQRQFPVQDPQQQNYYQLSAVSQQYHSPSMNQTAWSSPQSMSADDFDSRNANNVNYSYRGQAVSAAAASYNPSVLSPRTWPAAIQTSPPTTSSAAQFDLPLRSQEPVYDGLSNSMSMSPEELHGADLQVHLHYDNGAFHPQGFDARHLESERFQYESSPATDAPGSPYTGSPASFHADFSAEPDVIPPPPLATNTTTGTSTITPPTSTPRASAASKESAGGEEPYAKLIHRALLHAPDHSMTLQELYKWFRNNTDKPHKTEGTGWQNSIRHNLSMNEAFKRRLQAIFPNMNGNGTGTEKRVSEWYLNPQYIKDIRPTTHFRDGNRSSSRALFSRRNTASGGAGVGAGGGGGGGGGGGMGGADSNRRNSPPRSSTVTHYQNPDYPNRSMPGRAISGRRGGRATTSARNARRQRSQTGSLSPVIGGPTNISAAATAAAAVAQQQQHLQQHYTYSAAQIQGYQTRAGEMRRRSQRAEQQHHLTNPIMGGGVGPMAPATLASNNTSAPVAFMGGANGAQGGVAPQPYQLQQQQQHFGLADVSGVYNPSPPADDVIYGWGSDAQM
ncbi:fork head domain-containing protein [Colletotrichum higginsianum]|nr:fork head domain-containing protein [Colletotrichum higginsianum]